MKILIIGDIHGDLDIVNQYVDKSKCDIVLSVGDVGIMYRNHQRSLSKYSFNSNFYEYLEGKKKFNIPFYTVYGTHDNYGLVERIIEKDICVDNFHIIENGTIKEHEKIKIAGIGGSYSEKTFNSNKFTGYNRRHFTKSQVEKLKQGKFHILLLHDVIGKCSKKKVKFSQDTINLLRFSECLYCFIGQYHWWGCAKLPGVNVVIMPKAQDGYMILDTDNEWSAEGIRFDLKGE